jgi:hypothetical protein
MSKLTFPFKVEHKEGSSFFSDLESALTFLSTIEGNALLLRVEDKKIVAAKTENGLEFGCPFCVATEDPITSTFPSSMNPQVTYKITLEDGYVTVEEEDERVQGKDVLACLDPETLLTLIGALECALQRASTHKRWAGSTPEKRPH